LAISAFNEVCSVHLYETGFAAKLRIYVGLAPFGHDILWPCDLQGRNIDIAITELASALANRRQF
jgi:hypothetical protein